MVGGIYADLLVTAFLLILTHTGTQCRAENELLLVTLPDWRANSEYVTQCSRRDVDLICDWTRRQQITGDVAVDILESGPLGLEGEACLEFWYLAPAAAHGSDLRALFRSSAGLVDIWNSPANPRNSWRQVFVPLNITEPGSQVMIQDESMEGNRIPFEQIGVRRGTCGPQCESNTEYWTDESTRCLCSAGELSCSASQCPEGHICGPQGGGTSEISTSGTCTIHGHTDCSTFDGVLFRFVTPCTYVLAKTCSPTEGLPVFSVEVVYEQNGNASLANVQQVTVIAEKVRVSLLNKETKRVVVNGIWSKLPLNLRGGTVNIKGNPAAVVLGTNFGLSVSYDKAGAVHVTLPSTYTEKVCGLCGNFNHFKEDDLLESDSKVPQDATNLAESRHAQGGASSCDTILIPHQCDPPQEAKYASESYCGALLSNTGSFSECQSVLGAESYFRGCVVSMCTTHGDPAVLCETLQAYAMICQEAGVNVSIWRNSTFCSLQCGENSHYNSCAYGCPEVCSSLDLVGSCGSCEARCECQAGFKFSGEKCVPSEDCGCWHNGKHYDKGAKFIEGECVQQCLYMGNNDVRCTSMQCAHKKVCKVKDGVRGCFSFTPATCRVYGDPHYITFDGMAYDFQGGCSYTLTTTCGGENSVQFSVIGHNRHPSLENVSRSKLEAVTLQAEGLHLTLNQSGEVYLSNSSIQLPYTIDGTFGRVTIYLKNNYITLETTFGLQMMVDGQNRLFLQVDEHYKYNLRGLCGTYSGHQGDDFVTPGGQNVTEPSEFGDSWRVLDNDECTAYPNDPRVCDYDQENEAYSQCYTLLGNEFSSCHGLIHPSIYISSCVYDYCATNGEQYTLCESLKSYAAACQVAGVELPPWQTGTACADPPTTATPPATATSTSPTPDQTLCPMDCDFEKNLCGWQQLIQDSFDWTRHSGPTPSNLTGPNQDHTTGAGFYLYMEGDDVTYGDPARMLSSTCHYNGPLCLHFWYHMYGTATAMTLNIYLLKTNKATKVWSISNNQGPEWHPGNVDIGVSGPFNMIIEGIRGSNDQSDVAIDDISIHFGSCSDQNEDLAAPPQEPNENKTPPTSTPVPNIATVVTFTPELSVTATISSLAEGTSSVRNDRSPPQHKGTVCQLDCDFEHGLCDWSQTPTDAFDWTRQSGSSPTIMTGPSSDHTTGSGYYLYIEASSATHGDTARLISTKCSDSGPQCLRFWYHMYGSADTMGLHVYLLQDRAANAIWRKRNDQGNTWHLAQVDITTTGAFQIIFEGRRGSTDHSDVAVDDVKLYRGICADLIGDVTAQPQNTDQSVTATTSTPEPPVITVTPQPLNLNDATFSAVEATTNIRNDWSPPLHTAPICPENSHYSTCIPVCSPSCTHLNGLPGCSNNNTCVPGCVCDNGFVHKLQVCVPIQQCGCVDRNGSKHKFDEVWYIDHCSQKCECEKTEDGVGKVDCADRGGCDARAICLQNKNADFYCQSTGFSECTIKKDHQYETFDKLKHEFKGEQSYVLVQTRNLPNNVPDVYIEASFTRSVENDDDDDSQQHADSSSEEEEDDDSEEDGERHGLQQLKIRVYNHTVEFKNNWMPVVDGRITNTPVSLTSGLNIRQNSSQIHLKADFGLAVEFDGHSSAKIFLPHIYKRKVGGLCGNFDGQKWNDQMKPDGTRVRGIQEFGESWQV